MFLYLYDYVKTNTLPASFILKKTLTKFWMLLD